jgi:hypothetical protein
VETVQVADTDVLTRNVADWVAAAAGMETNAIVRTPRTAAGRADFTALRNFI